MYNMGSAIACNCHGMQWSLLYAQSGLGSTELSRANATPNPRQMSQQCSRLLWCQAVMRYLNSTVPQFNKGSFPTPISCQNMDKKRDCTHAGACISSHSPHRSLPRRSCSQRRNLVAYHGQSLALLSRPSRGRVGGV